MDRVIVNVRLSREQVKALDSIIQKKVFSSRSEAIRVFCREYIKDSDGL